MDDMSRLGKGIGLALAVVILAAPGCGGDPGPVDAAGFRPVPLAACQRDPGDGLLPDQRSLSAMIGALHARGYTIYQVSPAELTIFTDYKEIRGVSTAWQIRFASDGSGELTVPETMPPQDARSFASLREWGRGLAATFDRIKCLPRDQLRARCEKAGFSF